MTQKIIPTIGRDVLFNDGVSDQPVPAKICYVHDEDHINIGGFYADGTPFARVCVPLNHDCDGYELPEHNAGWMPFQKKYAAERREAGLDSVEPTADEGSGQLPPLDLPVNDPENYSALSGDAEGSADFDHTVVEGSDDVGDDHSTDGAPDAVNTSEKIDGADAVENSADSEATSHHVCSDDVGDINPDEATTGEAEHGGGL